MTQQELKARIAALEAMTGRLQDIEEIKQLMWSYTYFLDYGEYDKVMDCFVDDAKMDVRIRGSIEEGLHVGRYEGKKAILEGVYMVTPQTKDRFIASHLIANPVVAVEGERAKGRKGYFTCLPLVLFERLKVSGPYGAMADMIWNS